jgi:hypothetical protein
MRKVRRVLPGRTGTDLLDTEQMADFLDKLDHLNQEQLLSLAASWGAREKLPHRDALAQAVAAAAEFGLTAQMEEARGAAVRWALRGPSDLWAVTLQDERLQPRRQAAPALADAAVAIVLGGRLNDWARALLLEPWVNAVEGAVQGHD